MSENLLIPKELKRLESLLLPTAMLSNEISLKAQETQPWESKVGGCPYLRSKEEYPIGENGEPMLFFAQINLEEVQGIEELPPKGLLQFFVENDDMYGLESPALVRLVEWEKGEGCLSKHPYEDEEYLNNLPFYKEGRMSFLPKKMVISSSLEAYSQMLQEQELTEKEEELLYDFCYTCGCRIGGYPYFVQSDIGFSPEEDFLLLQLDVEDECGIMFGDSGNCNFFIKREDLKKGDFSQVWYDWQCC